MVSTSALQALGLNESYVHGGEVIQHVITSRMNVIYNILQVRLPRQHNVNNIYLSLVDSFIQLASM